MKWNSGNSHRVGPAETETSWVDAKMQSAAEYRRYAAECERIARDSAPSHRAVLLDIAKAWRDCAVEAAAGKRQSGRDRRQGGRDRRQGRRDLAHDRESDSGFRKSSCSRNKPGAG
jgi:hypothetical protein